MPRQAKESLEYQDFLNWTVTSLKDFLAHRGLKQTGKKAELVARAFGAHELKVPKKYTQEEIYKTLKDVYQRRLNDQHIKTLFWSPPVLHTLRFGDPPMNFCYFHS